MINLLDKFIEDMENHRIYCSKNKNADFQEIYFFQGKNNSLLVISLNEGKILANLKCNNLQIQITGAKEFNFKVGDILLFFLLNSNESENICNANTCKESPADPSPAGDIPRGTFPAESPAGYCITEINEKPSDVSAQNAQFENGGAAGNEGASKGNSNKNALDENERFKYRAFCEKCNSRKCSQYDTLNGRHFQFGNSNISDDLLIQHDKYCETKINKFRCLDRTT